MAKQRGIHQISGKVNNLCYYEQKYVRGGLIRRINEAMSGRLKTDPVFERTREANSLFGMCSLLSSSFFEAFGSGRREMLYPSVHAKFTAALLKLCKVNGPVSYGSGFPTIFGATIGAAIYFNSYGRNSRSPLFSFFTPNYEDLPVNDENIREVTIPGNVIEDFCKKHGANRLWYSVYDTFSIGTPFFSEDVGKYLKYGYIRTIDFLNRKYNFGDGDLKIPIVPRGTPLELNYVLVVLQPVISGPGGTSDRTLRDGFYYLIAHRKQ
jgi:hypothetical protein